MQNQPDIKFIEPSEDDVVRIYEDYRLCGEPDSPGVPFAALTDERRQAVKGRLRTINRIVALDGEKAGYISIVDEGTSYNFGFGLFKEFRGRGLMGAVIRAAGKYFAEHCKGKPVTSATRKDNAAAIRSLLAGGFIRTGSAVRPPLGAYAGPIEYVEFKYKR